MHRDWPAVALARQQQGLEPLADATPRALIRRLYFDLTGLPPAPEEVEQFVSDCANTSEQTNSAGLTRRLAPSTPASQRCQSAETL